MFAATGIQTHCKIRLPASFICIKKNEIDQHSILLLGSSIFHVSKLFGVVFVIP